MSLKYREPIEWTTGGVETCADYLIARVWDRDGREGAAEAVCRPAWNGMSQRGLVALFADIGWPIMSAPGFVSDHIGQVRDVGALSALLDTLLVDLDFADDKGVPPGGLGPAVSVVTRGSPKEMAKASEAAAARGFGAVKIKLGQGIEADEAILGTIRAAVEDSMALCGDANGAYDGADSDALMQLAERFGLTFVEDPCKLPPLAASLDQLRRPAVPVVVDRYCNSPLAARQFVDLGQRDIAAKPGRSGSTTAREMVEIAARRGGRAVIGLFGESDIGALAQLRLAALSPGETIMGIEASFHEAITQDLLRFEIGIADGRYTSPPTLHLAGAIDWERVEGLASSTLTLGN